MTHMTNAIGHSTDAPVFGDIRPDATEFADMPDVEVEDKADEPDTGLADERKRSPKAEKYEQKARNVFRWAFAITVRNPKTLPDAATILMHGPATAEAFGDLAAQNEKIARAIDMLEDTTDNAMLALMMAATPFIAQLLRNHEPVAEVEPKGFRIPFTQRTVRVKFNLKLRRLRMMTNEPAALTTHVFSNQELQEKLAKQGIRVVQSR